MSRPPATSGVTYAAAGVDVEAGDRAVALMKAWVARTPRPGDPGRHRRLRRAVRRRTLPAYTHPVLATSTDGVGTKVAIAQQLDVHDTIGFDLVGMVVDDIVVVRRRAAVHDRLHRLPARSCRSGSRRSSRASPRAACVAGCALVGGETAEHPGLLGPDEYDMAGAGTGRRRARRILGAAAGAGRRRRVAMARPACTPTATPWCAR